MLGIFTGGSSNRGVLAVQRMRAAYIRTRSQAIVSRFHLKTFFVGYISNWLDRRLYAFSRTKEQDNNVHLVYDLRSLLYVSTQMSTKRSFFVIIIIRFSSFRQLMDRSQHKIFCFALQSLQVLIGFQRLVQTNHQ